MQCGAAVKPYEFLEKEPIDTEYGVTGLVRERRDAFAAHYNRANTIGFVLHPSRRAAVCRYDADGHFSRVRRLPALVLWPAACMRFQRAGTIHDAMDQLLEEGDFTRDAKARKGVIGAVAAAYWLVLRAGIYRRG